MPGSHFRVNWRAAEANRIGWGASGRNGGFVSAGFAESIINIIKRVGLDEAKALYKLSIEGLDHVRRIIAERDPTTPRFAVPIAE